MEGAGCGRLPFDKTQPVVVSRTAEHSAPECGGGGRGRILVLL